MKTRSHSAARWVSVLLYMAGIFWLSSMEGPGIPLNVSDKLAHVAAYALLGALVLRAANGGLGRPISARAALLSFLLSAAYGVSDEWHQSFVPGRVASTGDVLADALGAFLAIAVLAVWGRRPYNAPVTADREGS